MSKAHETQRETEAALVAVLKDALEDRRWLKLDGPHADLARALRGGHLVLDVHKQQACAVAFDDDSLLFFFAFAQEG